MTHWVKSQVWLVFPILLFIISCLYIISIKVAKRTKIHKMKYYFFCIRILNVDLFMFMETHNLPVSLQGQLCEFLNFYFIFIVFCCVFYFSIFYFVLFNCIFYCSLFFQSFLNFLYHFLYFLFFILACFFILFSCIFIAFCI